MKFHLRFCTPTLPVVLSCLLFNVELCRATITIDSVHTTHSTCPNNGTATFFATSNRSGASLLYAVVAGPTLFPQQNDSTFSSLYPGTYTAKVYDMNSFDTAQISFTIMGTYHAPVLAPIGTSPFCIGGTDGVIIGNADTSTGSRPFMWQIISPYTTSPQASDTFHNLGGGTYIVKVTDICGNFQTRTLTLYNIGTGLGLYNNPYFTEIGCDTLAMAMGIYLYNDKAYKRPLQLTTSTNNGTTVKTVYPVVIDTFLRSPGSYYVMDTIANITYGDYAHVCVTDACNQSVCCNKDTIGHFTFFLTYFSSHDNCTAKVGAHVNIGDNSAGHDYISEKKPVTLTLKDTVSNTLLDSITIYDSTQCNSCWDFSAQISNRWYQYAVRDGCGHIYRQNVLWPAADTASVIASYAIAGCIDSVGGIGFDMSGFGSAVKIEILSGPTTAESSKPKFGYLDTIIYPQVYTNIQTNRTFRVDNMPPGAYSYRVSDSCGNTFFNTVSVSYITDLGYFYLIKKDCAGANTLEVMETGSAAGGYGLWSLSTNSPQTATFWVGGGFAFPNLLPDKYLLKLYYESNGDTSLISNVNCPIIVDTITISAYSDSTIKSNTNVICNGDIYIQLNVDSANGSPPYQYEIISGPEVFPLQNSSRFLVHTFGTYTVLAEDSCGNSDVRQITVDSARFDPIIKSGSLCLGSRIVLASISSPYYTYVWLRPDGIIFTGDTLVINSFAASDTGLYHVSKIVHINNCTDTVRSSYYLTLKDTFQQSQTLCSGDTLFVGPYTHTATGLYYDTLTNSGGCDSIVISWLNINPVPIASIFPATPSVCHSSNVILTASGALAYLWSTGADTATITTNPLVTTTYSVTVTDSNQCSGTASAIVYPATDSSVNVTQDKSIICVGDSVHVCAQAGFTVYHWNEGDSTECLYTRQAGNYYLTVTSSYGCTATSNRVSVAVYPQSPVAITLNGDTLKEYNQPSCQWYFNDTLLPGATSSQYIASREGLYYVTIIDSNGCVISSSKEQVNTLGVVGLGMDSDDSEIKLYPNPAKDYVIVETGENSIGGTLQLTDITGREIMKLQVADRKSQIQTSILMSGVYFIRLDDNDGSSAIKKFVVE